MNKDDARQFVAALGGTPIDSPKWVRSTCPLAPWTHEKGTDSNPSFGVSIHPGEYSKAHCFACQFRGDLNLLVHRMKGYLGNSQGNLYDLRKAYKLVLREDDELASEQFLGEVLDLKNFDFDKPADNGPVLKPFNESWLNNFTPAYDHPYLKERGIDPDTAKALDIRYDPFRSRICFPARTFDGTLAGLHGRDVTGDQDLRYYAYSCDEERNNHIWTGENHVDLDKMLVLTEGPFDYAKVFMCYQNVLCCRTASYGYDMANRIKMCSKIVTFFDEGTGGDKARERTEKLYGSRVVAHLHATGYGDAGAMPVEEIADILLQVRESI